jgi:hypothetical protein
MGTTVFFFSPSQHLLSSTSAFQEMTTQVVVAIQTDFRGTKGQKKREWVHPQNKEKMLSQVNISKGQRGESQLVSWRFNLNFRYN